MSAALSAIAAKPTTGADGAGSEWGLDPARFGKHPGGHSIEPASLCVQAPSVVLVRLPADLVAGCRVRHGRHLACRDWSGRERATSGAHDPAWSDLGPATRRGRRHGRERAMDVEQPGRLICDSRRGHGTKHCEAADRVLVR